MERAASCQENGGEGSSAGGTEAATWITVPGEGGHLCHVATLIGCRLGLTHCLHWMHSEHLERWLPTFLAPGTGFTEDNFSMDTVSGEGVLNDSSTLHLLSVYLAMLCGLWDLSSHKDQTPALGAQSSNHWTAREFIYLFHYYSLVVGFPGGSDRTESACNGRDLNSIPGSGRAPGGGNGNPLQYPVFLPGKSHGQKSLVGYSPWGHKQSDTNEQLTHTYNEIITQLIIKQDHQALDPQKEHPT